MIYCKTIHFQQIKATLSSPPYVNKESKHEYFHSNLKSINIFLKILILITNCTAKSDLNGATFPRWSSVFSLLNLVWQTLCYKNEMSVNLEASHISLLACLINYLQKWPLSTQRGQWTEKDNLLQPNSRKFGLPCNPIKNVWLFLFSGNYTAIIYKGRLLESIFDCKAIIEV